MKNAKTKKIMRTIETMNNERSDQEPDDVKDYTGTCYTCGEHVRVKDLVKLDKYYICELCHSAFWHGGYSPTQMIEQLKNTEQKRKACPEFNDKVRSSQDPISFKDLSEFNYNWMKYEKDIFRKLGGV